MLRGHRSRGMESSALLSFIILNCYRFCPAKIKNKLKKSKESKNPII